MDNDLEQKITKIIYESEFFLVQFTKHKIKNSYPFCSLTRVKINNRMLLKTTKNENLNPIMHFKCL